MIGRLSIDILCVSELNKSMVVDNRVCGYYLPIHSLVVEKGGAMILCRIG